MILLLVVFGWRTALFYGSVCLLAAIVVGWALGRVPRERALREYLWIADDDAAGTTARVALKRAGVLGSRLTRRFLPWLALATLAGIVVDALAPTATASHPPRVATTSVSRRLARGQVFM